MQENLEKIIKQVYTKWKSDSAGKLAGAHPDEQDLACFLEGGLSQKESQDIKAHITICSNCAEFIASYIRLKETGQGDVPGELLTWAKGLISATEKGLVLEIVLRLKERLLEIINTTGDILVNQELVPAALLRSRQIKDFKDEVTILKDFKDIRVEVRIENRNAKAFGLTVIAKDKRTQKIMKDLRVTLIRDGLELESYLSDSGSVNFEHVLLGKYKVEISSVDTKLVSVLLDIKT